MKNRITKDEIESTIELFVNSIYDCHGESGWEDATEQEWLDAVYKELITWKNDNGCCWETNENRFDGKENIYARIKPLLRQRLNELKEEGYAIKA